MPKLLVIGARGFLGSFLVSRSRNRYEVLQANRTPGDETDVALDVTDEPAVHAAVRDHRPDAVILLAAIADIDRCQREPELATRVNLRGAEHVANACARFGARLLFTSTGAVFDGLKTGYSEEEPVSPISIYGETKARAETAVLALVPSALILRVSLVLGRSCRPGTNSLVDSLIRRWSAGETVPASTLESRNPIDAATLSEWMLELLQNKDACGIFHAGSTEAITRYQIAERLASRLHVPARLVRAESEPVPGRAPRGLHQHLIPDKLNRLCATSAPSCEAVLERSLHEFAEAAV